jgi:predicted MFS family arabinose efflux permease
MNARAVALLATSRERWQLAGDQLYVDLNLSYENLPPGTTLVIGSAVTGVVGIAAFVFVESKVAFPLMPLEFFRRRNFSATLAASFFAGAAYMGGFIVAPSLLQSVLGYSVGATSMIMLCRTLAFALTSPLGGSAATKLGERPLAMAGTLAISASMIAHGFGAELGLVWFVAGALVLQGLGNGLSQPPLAATLSNSVDETDLGVAAAAQRMSFQVGSAVGITTMTSVYGGTGAASDIFNAYLVGAAFGALACLFAWMMRSTPREDRHQSVTEDPQVPAMTSR